MKHPPAVRLRKLLISAEDKLGPIREHVAACSRCRHRLEALRRRSTSLTYEAAFTRNTLRLRDLQSTYDKERAEAKGLVTELLRHPIERQQMLVRNHPRFHTWGVFESLLERSYKETARKPGVGEELASLSLNLSEHLDEDVYGIEAIEDLRGRAWAYIGNARRVQADLRGAQEAFDRALVHLRRGTREPWERAVWLSLKASLLRAQRQFDEAMRLLNRALVLFKAVGDRHWIGLTLLSMDNVFHHAGQPEKGIPLLHQAIELIDPVQESRLLLVANHNLIDDLAEAGRHMEAQRLLLKAHSLYRRFDEPWLRYRRTWVEGKIARGLGQREKAEELFEATRAGFLEISAAYDVALVSLDLGSLYTEQGRTAELKQLVSEMVPIFSSLKVHREALAAFSLWRQAVDTETAGIELVTRLASTLKRARYDQNPSGQDTL